MTALASSRVTLQHEVWLEGDAPLTLGELAKLEGEACRYHALEIPQQQPDDPVDLAFVIAFVFLIKNHNHLGVA